MQFILLDAIKSFIIIMCSSSNWRDLFYCILVCNCGFVVTEQLSGCCNNFLQRFQFESITEEFVRQKRRWTGWYGCCVRWSDWARLGYDGGPESRGVWHSAWQQQQTALAPLFPTNLRRTYWNQTTTTEPVDGAGSNNSQALICSKSH